MNDDALTPIFTERGALAECLQGFAQRDGQADLAARIRTTLRDGGVLACEAGTGTGKTLAYLIPTLLSGARTIISTGTRHLQDQIFQQDLPVALDVVRASGLFPKPPMLLKGRSNYLCLYRLRQNLDAPDAVDPSAVADLVTIRDWSMRTTRGDTAELAGVSERSAAWRLATSTRENCVGSVCEFFDRCYLFKARRRAAEADVVVVNHHLLLAQFVLDEHGHGELLPDADTLIVDEAHQLPALASEFFGQSLSGGQLLELARDVEVARRIEAAESTSLRDAAARLEGAVRTLRLSFGAGARRVAQEELANDAAVNAAIADLDGALDALANALAAAAERGRGLAAASDRVRGLSARLGALQHAEPGDHLAWFDVSARGFTWRLSPLDVAYALGPRLRHSYRSVVLTSATLAVGDSLDHFLTRVGLPAASQAVFASPFDYASQSLLYVPPQMPDPRASEFADALHAQILELLDASRGRAFVLFTSHLALRRAVERVAPRLRYPVLAQGDAPRAQLLARFRQLGDAVLLGTYSFWEGVDVRGNALSCVIIDKLPFASPGDPLLRARIERMREAGEDPFMQMQLPEAALVLKQGVGRLIRGPDDRGVVAVCDVRLIDRGYGQRLRKSLPPMPLTRDPSVVRAFFDSVQ